MRMFAVWYVDYSGKTQIHMVKADSKAMAQALTRKCGCSVATGAIIEVRNRG